MDYDLIVRNGNVIDGTGLPRRRVDLGIRGGRIAKIGRLENASASEEIDASGLIVAPGIVDAHTHYDPQITYDPYATMSCFHGVTTVLGGNCGFSAAPVRAQDRDFIKGVFARVEDMDPSALGAVRFDRFETFGEFMEVLAGPAWRQFLLLCRPFQHPPLGDGRSCKRTRGDASRTCRNVRHRGGGNGGRGCRAFNLAVPHAQ